MRRRLTSSVALATALLVSTFARPVVADPGDAVPSDEVRTRTDEARALFLEAVAHAKAGQWERARSSYSRSLALRDAPDTRYSLGVAQRNTGQLVEAIGSFETFLRSPATPATMPYRAPAQSALIELRSRVARLHVFLGQAGLDDEVTVELDGEPLSAAALGGPFPVNPGPHVLRAHGSGGRRAMVTMRLGEGEMRAVTIELVAVPMPTAVAEHEGPPALPLTLLVAGGAAMSAGVTTGLVGVLEADVAVGDDDARAARTKAIVGDTLAASGAVAATVGAVLWLTGAGRSEAPAGQVSPWARGPVAGVQVAF